jgi:Xaa-Pro aminopeptidase
MFVMKPANLRYLLGDGRPCALAVVTASGEVILAVPECDVPSVRLVAHASEIRGVRSETEMFHGFRDVLAGRALSDGTIGVERNFLDAALHDVFAKHVVPEATVVSATRVMSRLRMLKDVQEVATLREAAAVADAGMDAAVWAVRDGVTEIFVAGEAEHAMRRAGAEGWAAPVYVASGCRSAMAHGPASRKLIEAGDVVQVHVAPVVDGYTVDLCRTLFVGDVPPEARSALDAYIEAQSAGIEVALSGVPLLGIDTAMGEVLARYGYVGAFLRPTFHGVGLEHEEAPIPGGHAIVHGEDRVDDVAAGMVLAIGNCGIYRDTFGVRVEDTVWVSDDGPVELTTFPKRTQGVSTWVPDMRSGDRITFTPSSTSVPITAHA